MKKGKYFVLLALLLLSSAAFAQQQFVLDLYSGKPKVKGADKKDTARVWVYLPEEQKNIRRAVVILPGGGYEWLSMDNEGHGFAPFFNNLGIAAIVLKYRMPHGKPQVPVSDAEEAIRLVRRNAAQWKINPNDVGLLGSSAGGHLTGVVSTLAKDDARPNFQILFYPLLTMMPEQTHAGAHENFLGKKAKKKDDILYTPLRQVNRKTPRACIFFANDDNLVPTWNGTDYYLELYRHDIPASIFIYPDGGHGFGSSPFKCASQRWADLRDWIMSF